MVTVEPEHRNSKPLALGEGPSRGAQTTVDIAKAQEALESVLSSAYFRNSKRYPAFLRFVVEHTLSRELDVLKERTIGVTVFGKAPDYDTNYDPVVRVIAGEVRKRLAQYYEEVGDDVSVKIHLPTGTYVPEFVLAARRSQDESADVASFIPPNSGARRYRAVILVGLVLLVCCTAAGLFWMRRPSGEAVLWGPLLKSSKSIVISVGPPHVSPDASEVDTSIIGHLSDPAAHVSLPTAMALSQTSGYMESHRKQFRLLSASRTSLQDLNSQPTILIGGINNVWTMRFLAPLRYSFAAGPARIVDSTDPKSRKWSINNDRPYKDADADFALVALFHEQTIDAPVLVIAGVGANGTEAASRFVTSRDQMEQLDTFVRSHPGTSNIELVLKVKSIQGQPGTASIVAIYAW